MMRATRKAIQDRDLAYCRAFPFGSAIDLLCLDVANMALGIALDEEDQRRRPEYRATFYEDLDAIVAARAHKRDNPKPQRSRW